jgi:hypothetical protein
MFAYEMHQLRSADLIREAAEYRLAREARRAARTEREARRASGGQEAEGRLHTHRPRRHRQTRTA